MRAELFSRLKCRSRGTFTALQISPTYKPVEQSRLRLLVKHSHNEHLDKAGYH